MSGLNEGRSEVQGPDDETLNAWAMEAIAHPPTMSSWIDLVVQLRNGADQDLAHLEDVDQPSGLVTSAHALHHLVQFLESQPLFAQDSSHLLPLKRLSSAVIDLMSGKVSGMFLPQKRPGRPGNASAFEIVKALAARAMSELMAAGLPRQKAAQAVAERCKPTTWKTVAKWRENLMAGAGPGNPAGGPALFAFNRPLEAEMGATPRERAAHLLAELESVAHQLLMDSHKPGF